jgi:PilZ domain
MLNWLKGLFGKPEPVRRPPVRPVSSASAPAASKREDRRSPRAVVRVPVLLSREGRTVSAITAVVNDQGGLFVSPEEWPVGIECKVKHLDTKRTVTARVVWSGGKDDLGSYKLGLEFTETADGFWGAGLQFMN